VTEEVRKMMSSIFASMEVELVKFLAHFEKVDSFNSMYSYVRLSSHVLQVRWEPNVTYFFNLFAGKSNQALCKMFRSSFLVNWRDIRLAF
jgi:hypothetical protein